MGLNPPEFMYKINWDTWIWIVLLEIVVYGHLCLVLIISDIGFVKCGVFKMGETGSTNITIYLRFSSKWIYPLSSLPYKIVLDPILSVILWMVIFVAVFTLLEQIMYFSPPVFSEMMVPHMWLSSVRDILES